MKASDSPRPQGVRRRRVLRILAAAGGLGLAGVVAAAASRRPAAADLHSWQGTALGARASLLIHHPQPSEAQRLTALALAEIERLEKVFSLYRADSALSELNRRGYLVSPPLDLLVLLERARRWSEFTDGAFDVTLQPLWALYGKHFDAPGADPDGPIPAQIAAARRLVDYRSVTLSSRRIELARPAMAVTLNGIAQGYITDRVAALLRSEGLEKVLVDLGEIRALGNHPLDRPWRAGIKDPARPGRMAAEIEFADRALATSAANGTVFDDTGAFHHLLDPRSGRPARGLASASVLAREASDADALSTALLVSQKPLEDWPALKARGIDRVLTLDASGGQHEYL